MDQQAETQVPDTPPLAPGEASDPPFILSFVIWVGAFSAVVWGMMALFRERPPPPGSLPPEPEPDGEAEVEPDGEASEPRS